MENKINSIKSVIESKIHDINTLSELYELNKNIFDNKTGLFAPLMQEIKNIDPKDRPEFGKTINTVKQWALLQIEECEVKMKRLEIERKNIAEAVDVTMPGEKIELGAIHPNTLVINELIDIFASMGFEIYDGKEIEDEYYNFTALNTPKDHPARDMQDTFYITENLLLRGHTSPGQVHVMENKKPPIKVVCPGKVFRSDDDATHSPMFNQIEGLVVDKNVTLCDLKGMLELLAQKMFGENLQTRLRPSYFPFTEPSVEVDVTCFECGGKGCRLCKQTGWIEILGAGIVHKNVLENSGIDSNEYSALAFGMGIERVGMLKYGINNIKLLYESDTRFLKQFKQDK